ncbi:hypothetical protein GTA08_BOTSDO12388 [Botryosphaeria dothidea]|uniref:BTB domain-containing protein n=1 Tax=Botryosphaeria dothidea TaxID=55169 RepID=A0A8H4J6W8_9PEZI|nr:hypothetical protein GTA08_BOTSDO12388 [Botryosphaeria dothidea]
MFLSPEPKAITGKEQDARGALKKGLRNAFKNGDHSDITIKLSDGRELHCNRMIVFPQCDFFRAALEPGRFKVRRLHGDRGDAERSTEAVEAMLEFLYTADYSTDDELDLPDQLLFHLDM